MAGIRLVLVAALLAAAGCGNAPPPRDLLADAEFLVLEQRYTEAIPLLKQRLLEAPRDAGAHFYLGRCYLEGGEKWLGIAAGEFETALQIFLQSGKTSPIERYPDAYFEFACHMYKGKAYMHRLIFVVESPAARSIPPAIRHAEARASFAGMQAAAEAMEAINPGAPELEQFRSIIESVRPVVEGLPDPQPPKSQAPPATSV